MPNSLVFKPDKDADNNAAGTYRVSAEQPQYLDGMPVVSATKGQLAPPVDPCPHCGKSVLDSNNWVVADLSDVENIKFKCHSCERWI